ncbi:SSI family serine proteinase inhibitor [Pseudarthrobacter sp. NPDC058329]|uniref:SSI family serine proteinase inhibitor n=1 Tax=Pseudarthrobacter sp. NPDC058329 TaxID=3346448 RepID=UPI0036DCE479
MTDRPRGGFSVHSGGIVQSVHTAGLPRPAQSRGKASVRIAALLFAAVLLPACTPNEGGGTPSGSASASPTPSVSSPAPPATPAPSGSIDPDAESSVPAPAPEPAAPPSGPGQGNAELVITIVPSPGEPEVHHTLVCVDGAPDAESNHPAADAACAALKENAALLSPAPRPADQVCTEQYGGPQEATVTGAVDGVPVDTGFSRINGCEISAWDAAKDVLGAAGGAA